MGSQSRAGKGQFQLAGGMVSASAGHVPSGNLHIGLEGVRNQGGKTVQYGLIVVSVVGAATGITVGAAVGATVGSNARHGSAQRHASQLLHGLPSASTQPVDVQLIHCMHRRPQS